jgi:hypothetical protein
MSCEIVGNHSGVAEVQVIWDEWLLGFFPAFQRNILPSSLGSSGLRTAIWENDMRYNRHI